ncbi:serine/threonine-protein kinase SBK2-like [Sycon ciliatum]|uniref:serine/threonine-protein kinase SBK2-like n=1 Tax=Sycon ciliatum TaxID=27933 RepID=UPI0031F5F2DD
MTNLRSVATADTPCAKPEDSNGDSGSNKDRKMTKTKSLTSATNSKSSSLFDLFKSHSGSTGVYPDATSPLLRSPADVRKSKSVASVGDPREPPARKSFLDSRRRSHPQSVEVGFAEQIPAPQNSVRHIISEPCISQAKCAEEVTLVRIPHFEDVLQYLSVLHRKEDDKVIVYEARTRCDIGSIPKGTDLALKVLSNRKPSMENQFRNEFLTHVQCSSMKHPNIAQCYPVRLETENKSHFAMATELSRMGSLGRMSREVQYEQAVAVVRNIAQALQHVHSRGFTHCDVKRENIVRLADGDEAVYKLMDFGSARPLGVRFHKSHGAGYTTSYAPPEVFEENETPAGTYLSQPSIDVWELGITALRMCGPKPWKKAVPSCPEYHAYCKAVATGMPNALPVNIAALPLKLQKTVPYMLHPIAARRFTVSQVLSNIN